MAAELLQSRQTASTVGRQTHTRCGWLAIILVTGLVVYWLR
jgi:hypothetical protein